MLAGILVYRKIIHHKTVKHLTSIDSLTSIEPQKVSAFKIYPRVTRPVGTSKELNVSEPIIGDFFQSLTDLRSYYPSHDTVASRDHSWFLEFTYDERIIQIHFRIPSGKDDIVAGTIGKFRERKKTIYGHFQSRELFQWYQNYKDRWLKPDAPQEEN